MEFQVGDKVQFKTWEELKEEYGLNEAGNIPCKFTFTTDMDEVIDRSKVYTIKDIIRGERIEFEEYVSDFSYSEDMIKPYIEPGKKKRVLFDSWNDFKERRNILNFRELNDRIAWRGQGSTTYATMVAALLLKAIGNDDLKDNNYICQTVAYTNSPEIVLHNYRSGYESTTNKLVILRTNDYEHCCNEYLKLLEEDYKYIVIEHTEDFLLMRFGYINMIFCIVKGENLYDDAVFHACTKACINFFSKTLDETLNELLVNNEIEEASAYLEKLYDETVDLFEQRRFNKFLKAIETSQIFDKEEKFAKMVQDHKYVIEDMEDKLRDALRDLRQAEKDWAYYKYAKDDSKDTEELIEALKNSKDSIVYYNFSGSNLYIHYKQPLLFFDDDAWKVIREGFLQSQCNNDTRGLFDAIFARKVTIMLETGFVIRIDIGDVLRYTSVHFSKGIPNPHINEYNCWGDNLHYICKALQEGKNDVAFEQIKSALAGINVDDPPVMRTFANYIYRDEFENIECITDNETGEVMTLGDAIERYKDFKAEEE